LLCLARGIPHRRAPTGSTRLLPHRGRRGAAPAKASTTIRGSPQTPHALARRQWSHARGTLSLPPSRHSLWGNGRIPRFAVVYAPQTNCIDMEVCRPVHRDELPTSYNHRVHYVYIVQCVDGTLYTGYAVDLDR